MTCIFQKKPNDLSLEDSLMAVVAGCGQVGRGPRGGQCKALAKASGPVRAPARTVHLPTAWRHATDVGIVLRNPVVQMPQFTQQVAQREIGIARQTFPRNRGQVSILFV
jgi:hypothetical protein